MMPSIAARHRAWLLPLAAVAVTTALLLGIREALDKTHVALAYLLLVLGVSSRRGRVPGFAMSVAAFLCFNFFFLPPYYRLTVADPMNYAVLGAFLVVSFVAAQLLARARSEAASAEQRATEVQRLSALGAETLNAHRAEDALRAIAEVIRTTLGAALCEVYTRDETLGATALAARSGEAPAPEGSRPFGQPGADHIIEWVAANGLAALERHDGSMRVARSGDARDFAEGDGDGARMLVLPLRVRERTVGVLTVLPERALVLDGPRRRFLEALSYYAAVGVERMRLGRHAERAEALQKADEVKNAVLASVSHDLRTPLTTIKALAHEIRRDGDDRAATIEVEADRLNRFVADLLDLSRIAGGALHVTPEINAAEDLVGAALQRVSGALEDRALVATLDPSEPVLLGRFDFVHSLRVLGNLVDNAIKFAPPSSTIEVRARRVNGALEFVVADRGAGIPDAERDAIFQPFYRPASSRETTGVGLGLSIARGLAEAQHGALRCEAREGGGSLFIFSVPAADLGELDGAG